MNVRQFSIDNVLKYFIGIALLIVFSSANAVNLIVSISNQKNKPLKNAVVYAEPFNKSLSPKKPPAKVTIFQRNKAFKPHISVMRKGALVTFANKDPLKHHVYSFSPAKKFEIKLYSGKPPKTIVFDKTGPVILGCNIHDHMLAYIYVVDTPYYGVSVANGRVVLKGVPKGRYRLKIWHPQQKTASALEKIIDVSGRQKHYAFRIPVKPKIRIFRKRNTDPANYDDTSVFK